MKLIFSILLSSFILIGLLSCDGKKKHKKEIKNNKSNNSKKVLQIHLNDIKGKLFSYLPSNDPYYCDLTKIIETDCGIGYFYFSKKDKVCFTYECVGDTSIQYFLGDYKIKDNKVHCILKFEKECQLNDSEESFKSISPLNKLDEATKMIIEKAPCKNMLGYDNSIDSEKEFWLLQEETKTNNYFWNFFKTSKVKTEYLL